MKKKIISLLSAFVMLFSILPLSAAAADGQSVDLSVTVRDFRADGILFEGDMLESEGLVQKTLGADKKPVYNLEVWRELYGESIVMSDLTAFFNDVDGVNAKTTKTLTLEPDGNGYWQIHSSIDEYGNEQDGFFPIDNELFGNSFVQDGETVDPGHNFHFSVEIHTRFKYVNGGVFDFSGDDDVWVFFNGQLVIDLGGIHGESGSYIELDEIAQDIGISAGDIVDFDMFYMERHTTGSNLNIRTNFDFLNLQASAWAKAELEQADMMGLIPAALRDKDLTKPITRAEFAAVSVKVYEALSGQQAIPAYANPFTDTNDPDVLKAYQVGITAGTSSTTFSPDDLLNREQAATMLTRVYKKAYMTGWEMSRDAEYEDLFRTYYVMPAPFSDDASISEWARSSVYFMAANGIINGIGDNTFAPRATTEAETAVGYAQATREQALAIAVRMVRGLK